MSENDKIATKEIFTEEDEKRRDMFDIGGIAFFNWIADAGLTLPPWWSRARDIEIRNFWKEVDHLAGAVNTLEQMMASIPYQVIPRDATIKAHHKQAREFQFSLDHLSESRSNVATKGWLAAFTAFIQDYHTQDNGGWMVVEGEGIKVENPFGNFPTTIDGPLRPGSPRKLIQLDSANCWRTWHREFPLQFLDWDGKRIFIHESRILNLTSQPSPIIGMHGVGFCAVSRCPGIAQNLADIVRYKQEKMGSRPKRGLLVAEGGGKRDVAALENVLALSDEQMDNKGLGRYAPFPIVRLSNGGTLTLLDLNSVPDGFDELTSTQLGMSVIALAFGVDVRALAFAIGVAGQTKADAEIQHLKTWGKGPGYIVRGITQLIESKFLPPYLRIEFDLQDDMQDEMRAGIRKSRSERREKDISGGVTSVRVERQQMVKDSEITDEQFVELELEDGRLADGESVLVLFHSKDAELQSLLSIGLDASDEQIDEAIAVARERLVSSSTGGIRGKVKMALAALETLKEDREEKEPPVIEPTIAENGVEKPVLIEEKQGKIEIALPRQPDIYLDPNIVVNIPKQDIQKQLPPMVNISVPQQDLIVPKALTPEIETTPEFETMTAFERDPATGLVVKAVKWAVDANGEEIPGSRRIIEIERDPKTDMIVGAKRR